MRSRRRGATLGTASARRELGSSGRRRRQRRTDGDDGKGEGIYISTSIKSARLKWHERLSVAGTRCGEFSRAQRFDIRSLRLQRHRLRGHGIGSDSELLVQNRGRCRSAEIVMSDGSAGVLSPAERGARLDGDGLRAHGSRQDGLLVGGRLALEGFPARHGDNANLLTLRFELGTSLAREFEFGTGTDEDHVARFASGGALDDVRTLGGAFHGGTRKVRHDLAGERPT